MALDVNDAKVREMYGRIVLAGARLEANMAGMLAWLQTPRLTPRVPVPRRMSLSRMIEQARLCLSIREDDGVIAGDVAERLRGFLDRGDRARELRNRFVHSSTVIIQEADHDIRGNIDFVGDYAVTATLDELEKAGQNIDAAGSEIYLARQVAEYQMGTRPWG